MDEHSTSARLPKWLFIPAGLGGILVTFLLNKVFPFAMAEAAGFCTAILAAATVAMWPIRHEFSVRIFSIVVLVATILGLLFIPWPEDHEFQKFDAFYVWLYSMSLVGVGVLTNFVTRLFRRSNDAG